ncbi:MAG: TOBE domain-containing protein [Pseudodesulfovibrio sp.]
MPISLPANGTYLDSLQLHRLEQAFRAWTEASPRRDVALSRRRILLIFLLIRYTGAKLNEVLSLNPFEDIDPKGRSVRLKGADDGGNALRSIQVSEELSRELRRALDDPEFTNSLQNHFSIDPGFVRRKFYERAEECGLDKRMGSPEMLRQARAVELMRGNLPLPAVQRMLGQSTVHQTASRVPFSAEELQQVTRLFMDRESDRRTSARNAFYGKIAVIEQGDIQSRVELVTVDGHALTTLITNNSRERLGLCVGKLATAEIKAPYVLLQRGSRPRASADNAFEGAVVRIAEGRVSTEYVIRISEAAELCAVVSAESGTRLDLRVGDHAWAMFNCFAVVLHV